MKALPTITAYCLYLDKAMEKFSISRNEARNKYGLFTCEQWETLLNQ